MPTTRSSSTPIRAWSSGSRPLSGNRNDRTAWEQSSTKAAVGNTFTVADDGYPGTGLVIPHRRRQRRQSELVAWNRQEAGRDPMTGEPDSYAGTLG